MTFTGAGRTFFNMLLKGSLLTIPTLGFYRFWLLTQIRRHLWSHTRLGGESFAYTGTARELLIGFLVAVAVLVPIYVAYFVLGILAEEVQAFASLPLFFILYVLGQYASFRARRYRATRTVFRGVRFWMTGSAWGYAGLAFLWDLLTLVTLGLAYPWRTAALERYKMARTRYGDVSGAFVGTGGAFFRKGVWLWLVLIVLAIVNGAVGAAVYARGNNDPFDGAVATVALIVLNALALAVIYPIFQTIQTRWHLSGLRFGEVTLASDLRKSAMFGVYLRFVGAIIAYLALATVLMLVVADMAATGGEALQQPLAIAGLALGYLVFILGFGIIKRYVLDRGFWVASVSSVAVTGFASIDAVVARGDAAGSFGEGLADALDVGGF